MPVLFPNDMRVGETLGVDIVFVDPTGSVMWTSDDPSVVTWDKPSPACPGDGCRVLRGVARGTTYVSMTRSCSDRPSDGCGQSFTRVRVSD